MTHLDSSCGLSVWGADPGLSSWAYLRSVKSFEDCSTSEYIRVFPRLLPLDSTVPQPIRTHLTKCVAALAWHLHRLGWKEDPLAPPLGSLTPSDVAILGPREHGRWFPADDFDAPGWVDVDLARRGAERKAALSALSMLGGLLGEVEQSAIRQFDAEVAALFTFTTGIHAVYVWSEALLSHEFYTAVGWLGQLRRGRRAAMPGDLSEYFSDVLEVSPNGMVRCRDKQLEAFLPEPALIAEVWRTVRCSLRGCPAVADWSAAKPWSTVTGAGRPGATHP